VVAVGAVVAALGGLVAGLGVYQLALAVAAFWYRPALGAGEPRKRVGVLVPAHDEEASIARCVRSLLDQDYPRDLFEVIVIADNCTDQTAAVAGDAGAEVLVRDEPDVRGKGRALRWALDQLLERTPGFDAFAVVDADSTAGRDFLAALVRPLEEGAGAAQAESRLVDDGSGPAALRAGAFRLVNWVRPAGRAVLGLGCNLQGNGMLVSADVLRRRPWDAFSATEDLEYSIGLLLSGVRARFAGGAIVESPAAPSREAAIDQQLRWEGGKLHVARTQLPRLLSAVVRKREPALLEAAVDLAVPPLGILAAIAAAGTLISALLAALDVLPAWSVAPWALALVAIPVYVLVGFRAAHAPASAYRSLLSAPLFVLRKAASLHRFRTFRPDSWVRTKR
jgi:1,2-diacylglycerol 3-beta-glucosyltransferase